MDKKLNTTIGFDDAVKRLQAGDVCAFATDTVFGIGVRADQATSIEALYIAKQRPKTQALIVLCADLAMVKSLVKFSPAADSLARLWPGSLTLILPTLSNNIISNQANLGLNNLGVRIPNSSQILRLIKAVGCPLATSSANISGQKTAQTLDEFHQQFGDKVPMLSAEEMPSGKESTIIQVEQNRTQIIRVGALSVAQIERHTGAKISPAI